MNFATVELGTANSGLVTPSKDDYDDGKTQTGTYELKLRTNKKNSDISRESKLYRSKSLDINHGEVLEASIHFSKSRFIKEIIYGMLHYFSLPYIILFDGGLVSAENHVFLPIIRDTHPVVLGINLLIILII